MKLDIPFLLLICICIILCACETTKPKTANEDIAIETVATKTTIETAPLLTEPIAILATNPPRICGPEQIEGKAISVGAVSVKFTDELPHDIRSSTCYVYNSEKDKFILNSSQQYAEVHFTITNKTEKEIKIADIHDDFLVELIFDDRYIYSPDSDSWCFFKAGGQIAVVSNMSSVGSVSLDPLSTKDVVAYIPCSRAVATDLDKYLIVVFSSNHGGFECLEFIIR